MVAESRRAPRDSAELQRPRRNPWAVPSFERRPAPTLLTAVLGSRAVRKAHHQPQRSASFQLLVNLHVSRLHKLISRRRSLTLTQRPDHQTTALVSSSNRLHYVEPGLLRPAAAAAIPATIIRPTTIRRSTTIRRPSTANAVSARLSSTTTRAEGIGRQGERVSGHISRDFLLLFHVLRGMRMLRRLL
ncbi:hypothetical protein BST61_g5196 [Cercospora zeina]